MCKTQSIIIQHTVTLPKYGHGALNIPRPCACVVNRYPAIYVISCVGEENDKIKRIAIKLCFVINVLNNKTIILLNLPEYFPSQLGLQPRQLSTSDQAIFRTISQDNCYKVTYHDFGKQIERSWQEPLQRACNEFMLTP